MKTFSKKNIIYILVIFSATFVCFKLTPGGEVSFLVLVTKGFCRLFLAIFISINIYTLIKNNQKNKVNETFAILIFLILIIFLSIIYSVDRVNTAMAIAEFVTSAGAGIFIARNYRDKGDILLASSGAMGAITCATLLYFYFLSPGDIFVSMNGSYDSNNFVGLGGSIIHVHSLAMLFLVILGCSLWSEQNSIKRILISIISIIVILATLSRTGFIILILVLMVWLILRKRSALMNLFIFGAVTLGGALIINLYFENLISMFVRGASTADLMSGSNRTYIFVSGLKSFLDSPLLGFGFDNLSLAGDHLIVDEKYERSSLHNQFLYILVSNGLIGAVVFLMFLTSAFIKSVLISQKYRLRNFSFFIVLLIFSMTQDTLMNDSTPLQFLTFVLVGTTIKKRIEVNV